jgi:hypothetical protein
VAQFCEQRRLAQNVSLQRGVSAQQCGVDDLNGDRCGP